MDNPFHSTLWETRLRSGLFFMLLSVMGFCPFQATQVQAAEHTFDYSAWHSVLERYVDDNGRVDYQGLSTQRRELDEFLALVREVGPSTHPGLFPTPTHELAYYINAYNALVFEGVLSRGPEQKSVWRGLISGLNFFVRMDVMLDGATTNLRNLENDIIRDRYRDPRTHAALNCASISCPRLPPRPFAVETLDRQLDDAMREFVASISNVRVERATQTVYLSEVFDWFDEDFIEFEEQSGNTDPSLVAYVNRYRSADRQIAVDYKLKFIPYDKGINSQ